MASKLLPVFGGHSLHTRLSTFLPAQPSQFDGGLIPIVRLGIEGLAGRDVANHLREREGIARAFLPSFRHATIIAQSERIRIAVSRCRIFKLTHYPELHLA